MSETSPKTIISHIKELSSLRFPKHRSVHKPFTRIIAYQFKGHLQTEPILIFSPD
jgi:hypothetical protein